MTLNKIPDGTATVLATADGEVWVLGASNTLTGNGFVTDEYDDITLSVAGSITGANIAINADAASTGFTFLLQETAVISGGFFGVQIAGQNGLVVNDGSIAGSLGMFLSATASNVSILNSGSIATSGSGFDIAGQGISVNNSGSIESATSVGVWVVRQASDVSIINSGTITGDTFGVIFKLISGGATGTGNQLVNSGTITGGTNGVVFVDTTELTSIFNSGTIESAGSVTIQGDSASQHIINTGTIDGKVKLGGGRDLYDTSNGVTNGKIMAGGGKDTILTGSGKQIIDGGGGNDLIDAGAGDDKVTGGSGRDILLGRGGKDTLNGNAGDDVLEGGAGRDTLDGGSGEDIVNGGRGNDTITGGADADIFVFSLDDGNDTITDYVDGTDLIDLSAAGIASFGVLSGAISSSGGDAIIDMTGLGGTGVITVDGAAGLLSLADFIL